MRSLWLAVGRLGFWCAWPALWIYLRGSQRSRLLLVDEAGRVLVVKGWLSTQQWSLPGGGMHKQEDPKLAAIREAEEEAGITVQPEQLQFLGHKPLHNKGFIVDTYLYGAKVAMMTTRLQRFEIIAADWVEPGELTAENAEPDVLTALQAWSR
jgi:8-oxo-dGTP pyrophosphatase MutT (NUDIX family)